MKFPRHRILVLGLLSVLLPAAGLAQSAASENKALELQQSRKTRVEARGRLPHYTKRWDLADLPAYQPEVKISGTIRIYGLNYLTDGNLGKYWDEGFREFHPGAPVDPKVREFLRYVLSREGQEEVERDGKFLPLISSVLKAQREKIE